MKKFLLIMALIFSVFFIGCEADFSNDIVKADDPISGADQIRYNGYQGEPVLLVHGNGGSPSNWSRTITYLKSHGWPSDMIVAMDWHPNINPAMNDHCGSELDYVKAALTATMAKSRTGKIDVMGHSLGATLAAKAIIDKGWGSNQIRTFVGIAGAFRGLNTCTYSSYLPTCSKSCGLHYQSSVLSAIRNKGRFAQKQYAIFSYIDEITCAGSCYIWWVHTSKPYFVDSYYTPYLGHFGLLMYTESKQADYLDNY